MRKYLALAGLLFTSVCVSSLILQTNAKPNLTQPSAQTAPTPLEVVVLRPQTQTNGAQPIVPTEAEVKDFVSNPNNRGRRALAFRKFRKMLLDRGVPFEPNMLLENGWQERLKKSGYMNSLESAYIADGKLSGAVLADTLYLPEKVELKGDTVILARRLVYEGDKVLIRGYGVDVALMPVEPSVVTRPIKGAPSNYQYMPPKSPEFEKAFFAAHAPVTNKAPDGVIYWGSVTVDVSGWGWAERLAGINARAKAQAQGLDVSVIPLCPNGQADRSGCGGTEGSAGLFRPPANKGEDSPNPVDGTCNGDPNGRDTPNASPGDNGERGGDAPDYGAPGGPTKGDDGGSIDASLTGGETGYYLFLSNGGMGGRGGQGGRGGNGGDGGNAKRGGQGATCGLAVGNGGRGADGGMGGRGGDGGTGGDGGKGGNGGSVVVNYYPNANLIVEGRAAKGEPGPKGPAGEYGGGGVSKPGAPGGDPGNPVGGIYGSRGGHGEARGTLGFGNMGSPGSIGTYGDSDGQVDLRLLPPPPPGGGGCYSLIPPAKEQSSSLNDNCGDWDLRAPVYYVHLRSYDGGRTWTVVNIWYAGCFII
jgi:hypothetical protein